MKKFTITLLVSVFALVSALSVSAKYRSVTVHLKNQTTVTVDLAEDLAVRFNDLEMIVSGSSVENRRVIIEKSDIDKFEHSLTAGIDNAVTDAGTPVFENGAMSFSNLPAGTQVQVFDIAGRELRNETAVGGNFTLDLSTLTSGTYVVNINGKSFKIAVK